MGEERQDRLPPAAIDKLVGPLQRFLHVEAAGGVVLLACTAFALVVANSPLGEGYLAFWKHPVGIEVGEFRFVHSLKHWIDDGLMAIFFFVIGLEVKREIVLGELRDARRAALPILAAIGGMVVPAGVYLALQAGQPGAVGWGIPMATDIAFVVGCMAMMSSRVPHTLRILVLSLAIADDIGAILVIAVGYTDDLDTVSLMLGFAGLALVYVLGRLGVRSLAVYTAAGALVWFYFHESGVHATIAGVLLGLLTPAQPYAGRGAVAGALARASEVFHGGDWDTAGHRVEKLRGFRATVRESVSPLEYLEITLHPWVGFVIMPVFALANAGVVFEFSDFGSPVALAVIAGLVVGKPVGILIFSWVGVKLRLASLPEGVTWPVLFGGGALAGIGFTMALFIAGLALEGEVLDAAKVGILGGSALAAVVGFAVLLKFLPAPARKTE